MQTQTDELQTNMFLYPRHESFETEFNNIKKTRSRIEAEITLTTE